MIIYALIMFLTAVLFAIIGFLIGQGKTQLIHNYHQTKVKDKAGYGKAMGRAIIGIGISAFTSAIASLISSEDYFVFIAVGIFILGFIISFIFIYKAQRKYNCGMF